MTREEAINEIKSWDFLEGKEIEVIHTLIPELAESEDEKIIRLLREVGSLDAAKELYEEFNLSYTDVLCWLEKQKEKKPATIEQVYENFLSSDTLKSAKENKYIRAQLLWKLMHNGIITEVDYQYLTDDKHKPWTAEEYSIAYQKGFDMSEQLKQKEHKHTLKFKVGDKVHLEGDDVNILTITGIEKDRYLTDCAYGPILFGAEDNWERIEQKPVKRIDFYDELYKRYTGPRDILAYVNMFVKKLGYVPIDIDELSACVYYVIKHKEEDTKAKETKQKTAEWGEEERKILDSIIDDYEKASKSFCGYDGKILVLKAIRDGNLPKPAWSEKDRDTLLMAATVLKDNFDSDEKFEDCDYDCETLAGKLLEMRYRISPSWKPSEEQMEALERASTNEYLSAKQFDILVSLYEQLKKLM